MVALREVEVKARAPLEHARSRLRELGARLVRVEEQEDVYFSHPCRDFSRTDEALRLRLAPGRVELTYKGPRRAGPVKSRLEVTARVVDAQRILEILDAAARLERGEDVSLCSLCQVLKERGLLDRLLEVIERERSAVARRRGAVARRLEAGR